MARISILAAAGYFVLAGAANADTPYQVLRPGDNDTACEVLSTEINSLNAEVLNLSKKAERQAKAAALGKGVFAGLARSASVIGYGSTSSEAITGLLASSVAAGVAQEVASGAAAPPPPQQTTPQQQRLTHLTGIYRSRPC